MIDLLLLWYEGYEIWSNMKGIHPAFDTNYITKKKGNLHVADAMDLIKLLLEDKIPEDNIPKVLLLDEIKTQANARNFGSSINKYLTDFVSQARKRQFQLIYTDQIIGAYDRWMRLMTDKVVRCIPDIDPKDLGLGNSQYPEPVKFRFVEINLNEDSLDDNQPIQYEISRKLARNFYPLYKTREVQTPIELKYGEVS